MSYAKSQRQREPRRKKADRKDPVGFLRQDNLVSLPYKNSKVQTKKLIKPCTKNQKLFVESLRENDFTFGLAPAGCGKTLLAIHEAICQLNSDNSPIEKIVYVRANVGCKDELELGALPGELDNKVTHLTYPVYDACREFMTESAINSMFEFNKIEVLPVAFLRGRSFPNTYLIIDEAQNLTKSGLKTALTRRSHGSKMALTGDSDQCDLPVNNFAFLKIATILSDLNGIGCVTFGKEDILRDDLIFPILERLKKVA